MYQTSANITNRLMDGVLICDVPTIDGITSSGLKIMQINAQSINSRKKFNKFLTLLSLLRYKIHVIVVSETWLDYSISALYDIAGFQSYHSCRRKTSGGGLCVYVSDSIPHNLIGTTDQ